MQLGFVRGGLAAAIVLGSTMWAVPASAGGGGGCRGGATEGRGETVAMSGSCFSPTVLRVDPGTAVTFVNRDFFTHNVSAMGWGRIEPMVRGDSFTATFDEDGVYPYACTYHTGMTGAVVVGEGLDAGTGGTVGGDRLVTRAAANTADGTSTVGWAVGGAGGVLLGAASVLLLRRRRTVAD
jgi:plastocyanin